MICWLLPVYLSLAQFFFPFPDMLPSPSRVAVSKAGTTLHGSGWVRAAAAAVTASKVEAIPEPNLTQTAGGGKRKDGDGSQGFLSI